MNRPRILIISSHLQAMGGAEKNVLDVARGLKSRCDIEVVGMQCGQLIDTFRSHGITVHDVAVRRIVSVNGFRKAAWLFRKIRREKTDVVVTYHHDADLWGGMTAKLAGVPVISSRRDMGYQLNTFHRWIYRFINPIFVRIVAVADAVKKEIVRTQWASPDSIVTIYNGLEETRGSVDKAIAKKDLGLDPSRPVVGMVSSFRPVKGQDYFARAAAAVVKKRPDAQFVIVGDTNSLFFNEVQKLMEELSLKDIIRCTGARGDIPGVLSAFDIFVLPSRQEGFSNALVEAMAAGVPVVAASVGGNPEAVDHGVNGLLFEKGDHAAMAAHILDLLNDPPKGARLAASARSKVSEAFSFDGMLDKLYVLFREAA
jgi:L-malate glycosyltransferase